MTTLRTANLRRKRRQRRDVIVAIVTKNFWRGMEFVDAPRTSKRYGVARELDVMDSYQGAFR